MLAVDLNFAPRPHLPGTYWGAPETTHQLPPTRLPYDAAFVALGRLGLVGLGEKTLLVALVFLAGYGMHRLVAARSEVGRVYAGVLYAVNPFVFDRIWTGQWFLLLGYALLPWGLATFTRALDGDRAAVWRFGLVTFFCAAASAHMAALLAVACVLVALFRRRLARALAPGAVAVAACLYWLLPTAGVADFWQRVGPAQLEYYRSVAASHWPTAVTLAGLSGFWNDSTPVRHYLAPWPILTLVLLLLALWGLVLRRRDAVARAVAVAALLGFLLALGTTSVVTDGAFRWLMANVQPIRSFREPQKAIALLAFAYAYLGAPAVDDLVGAIRRPQARALAAALLVALPVVFGYRELYGLWGRMSTSAFPQSWAQARPLLPRDARTLFLPWGGYLDLSFAHYRLVANPAQNYFGSPLLASREVSSVPGTAELTDPEQGEVTRLLAHPRSPDFTRCLARRGVAAILVANEPGAERFAVLAARRDLTLVHRWGDLVLYRLVHPGALAMRAAPGRCGAVVPLAARLVDPAHIRLARPPAARVALGVAEDGAWRVRGQTAVLDRWAQYRRNYLIGALAWVALGAAWFGLRIRRRR